MPEFIGISFSEEARSRFCLVVGVGSSFCLLSSLVLVGTGAYIKISTEKFTVLIEDYEETVLPYMLITVGLLSAVFNFFGGFFFFGSANPKKREVFRRVLFAHCVGSTVMCVILFVGGVMCFSRLAGIEDAFNRGLRKAMQKYSYEADMKVTMDLLQVQYFCCGNDGYEDWFGVPWIHEDFLNVESAEVSRWVCR